MVWLVVFMVIGLIFFFGSIDDLVIDLGQFIGGLKPTQINRATWTEWQSLTEKPIALMIPAWKEANVLESMVRTNLSRIQYRNFKWFIGVYPNDLETLEIAKALEKTYPSKITVVLVDRPGPTSKAHCLNRIFNVIDELSQIAKREKIGWIPHYIAIHDAEDVIHPLSLTAINAMDRDFDFIQIPIFSLPVPAFAWVAGTYLDEFAEIHLKEIPVRQLLKMPVPSAGVGTFFSSKILTQLLNRFGYCFDENNLTEDYEISQRIARLEGKQSFLLIRDDRGEILATREYFPDSIGRSVRQKTRWTTGIGLQTLGKWKRFGRHLDRSYWLRDLLAVYALYRDRKALWANPIVFLSWSLLGISLMISRQFFKFQQIASPELFFGLQLLFIVNTLLFTLRMFQRLRFTAAVYGGRQGIMAIPRLFPSHVINGLASLTAIRNYMRAQKSGFADRISWAKTDHKFPDLDSLPNVERSILPDQSPTSSSESSKEHLY